MAKDIIKLSSRPCSPTKCYGFLTLHYGCKILTGSGACHSGGLRSFRSDNTEQWQCCTTLQPADTFTPSAYDTPANQLPILFLPLDDIASRNFLSISWASCYSARDIFSPAVYCNRSCLWRRAVSVTTITRNCVHRFSPNLVCRWR